MSNPDLLALFGILPGAPIPEPDDPAESMRQARADYRHAAELTVTQPVLEAFLPTLKAIGAIPAAADAGNAAIGMQRIALVCALMLRHLARNAPIFAGDRGRAHEIADMMFRDLPRLAAELEPQLRARGLPF